MSVNHLFVSASPEAVFGVFGDAHRYAEWVVGAKKVRKVEGDWPAPGSRFFHSVGAGPLTIKDTTTVVDAEPPHGLVLEANVRPLLTAMVSLTVTPTSGGSEVVMEEHPTGPLPAWIMKPLLDPFTSRRNAEALRRLKELVERGNGG